MIKTAEL